MNPTNPIIALLVSAFIMLGMSVPDSTSPGFKPFSDDAREAVPLHLDMGTIKYENGKYAEALDHFIYCAQNLQVARHDGERGLILKSAGMTYYALAEYQKSLSYLLRAEQFLGPGVNDSLQAVTLDWASVVYLQLGDFENSLQYQLRSIRIRKTIKDSLGLASSYYTLGDLYSRQENFKAAIDHFKHSLTLAERYKDSALQYSCNASLANFYEAIDSLNLCYQYSQHALTLAQKQGDVYGRAYARNTLGSYFLKMGQPDSAIHHFSVALALTEALVDQSEMCVSLMGLGSVQQYMGNLRRAEDYFEEALAKTFEFGDQLNRIEIYARLSHLQRARGNFQKALEYKELSFAVKDSLMSDDAKFNMANLRSTFETQQEVERLEAEKEAALLAQQRRLVRTYKLGIAGGLLLISLVGWLLYGRYRARRRTYLEISARNEVIHAQNQQLKHYNEDLELMAYAISHDLRDPLNHIGTLGNVIREAAAKGRYDDMQKCADLMATSSTRMLHMLTSLYRYTKLDDKNQALSDVDMKEVAETAIENLNGTVADRHVQIHTGTLPDHLPAVREHMVLLLQNLIGNGIKYNPVTHPEINVDCVRENGHYKFCVSDNGPGIDPKYHGHIFGMFNRVDSSSLVQGSGMGLALCRKIVNMHKGNLWVESDNGKGSRFYFTVPATRPQPAQ